MLKKYLAPTGAFFLAALLLIAVLSTIGNFQAQAAPPPAPTPLADYIVESGAPRIVTFQSATAIAADTNTSAIDLLYAGVGVLDLQYVIDQGSTNTNTLTIQYSNDNSNWVDGLALVTNNVADASDITRVPVFGRYMRVEQDLTTTDTITITLVAVGR